MTFGKRWRRLPLVGAIALWVVFISVLPSPAVAMPIPSQMVGGGQSSSSGDLAKLQSFLEEKKVRERLKDLGFSPEEISSRLARLSPQQLHEVAQRTENLRVGADAAGALVAIVLILAIVILVLELTGHRIISR
ncbi:MAG: PA2779 family protein [Candidatus Tectomicrobia bacterium]|uniref:PA2779 family protein n=1 Tax=Tectimicrobiota bacterium TaxID=2528274 RepID=A0A932GPS7_UNCTE|nr:PA2779 family protein [Candidatus Tectomicrobia bacterium]